MTGPLNNPDEELLPCRWCHQAETRKRLSLFGARCGRCFDAYKAEPQAKLAPEFVGDKKRNGPKDWTHALKRREEAGHNLTQAQRDAWRAALRGETGVDRTEAPL